MIICSTWPGSPRRARHNCAHVSPGVLYLLDRLTDTPAFVIDDLGALLVQNRMSKLVSGDQTSFTGRRRNHTWRWFTEPEAGPASPKRTGRTFAHARCRPTCGGRPPRRRPRTRRAGRRPAAASPEFAALWPEHEVAVRRSDAKRLIHPGSRPARPAVRALDERRRRRVPGRVASAAGYGLSREARSARRDRDAGSEPRRLSASPDAAGGCAGTSTQ